ncbi:ComEC/Rec2 family competence protein [Jonesia quinghaiensis]|uniref:ComEC/Rec2 family competence protein n=1 Tax=Jonesia quinghaiensis TaxID=262806 RepID=UPI0003F8D6FE|nr:ComEC/Rec2 family competence protein [Jonesia quinghaiensis]
MKVIDYRLVPVAGVPWIAAIITLNHRDVLLPGVLVVACVAVVCAVVMVCVLRRWGSVSPRVSRRVLAACVGVAVTAVCTMLVLASAWGTMYRAEKAGWYDAAAQESSVCAQGVVLGSSRPTSSSTPQRPVWYADLSVQHVTVMVLSQEPLDFRSVVSVCGTVREAPTPSHRHAFFEADSVEVLQVPSGTAAWANSLRAATLTAVADMSDQARGLVPGTAIGDTSLMSDELDAAMKVTGLTHITAVSGSHFALIFTCALLVLRSTPVWLRGLLAGLVMVVFVVLVQPQPSVMRAAAMAGITVLALLLRRPHQGMTALSWAVIVLLIADPQLAVHYGFVLSVVATAGLIVGTRPLAVWLHRPQRPRRWMPYGLAAFLAVPLAAWIACTPILILLEPSVSLYSVPANAVATLALAPATLCAVAGTLLSTVAPGIAMLFFHAASGATWWIAMVAQTFAAWPSATVPWLEGIGGAVAVGAVLVVVVGVLSGGGRRVVQHLVSLRQRARSTWLVSTTRLMDFPVFPPRSAAPLMKPSTALIRVIGVLVVAIVIVVVRPAWLSTVLDPPDGAWVVAACDVGQGDAFLVQDSTGHTVMVDVGPPGQSVTSCLDDLGVTRISTLVLSHAHEDHVGALEEVAQHVPIDHLIVSYRYGAWSGEHVDQVARVAQFHQTKVSYDYAGVSRQLTDTLTYDALWPAVPASTTPSVVRGDKQGQDTRNDDSLAIHLTLTSGEHTLGVTFLGDVEHDAQERLANTLTAEGAVRISQASTRIVKMSHHGSASQSQLLADVLNPDAVLIGVGRGNTYGHPHKDALAMYQPAVPLRTDTCHNFEISAVGDELVVHGCAVQQGGR